MKRFVCIVLAAMTCVMLFSGCSKPAKETTKTAKELALELQKKGFPVENILERDQAEKAIMEALSLEANATCPYTSAVAFADRRLEQRLGEESPTGGTIEVYATEQEAKTQYDQRLETHKDDPKPFAYEYWNKNVLLRMDRFQLSKEQADEYRDALDEILRGE